MAYLTTLTLDELSSPAQVQSRILPTGRLDEYSVYGRAILIRALIVYLTDKGPDTKSNDPRVMFQYTVTDSDIDTVVDRIQREFGTRN